MKRRRLLAGVLGAATSSAASDSRETLYIPDAHRSEDLNLIHDLMDAFPFADLVTTSPTLRITHIPVWLDRAAGKYGAVYGHVAKNNPQSEAIAAGAGAVLVFHGPHAYISPTWYENRKTVPTWNFAAVHVSGTLERIGEGASLYKVLQTLVARSEPQDSAGAYSLDGLPSTFTDSLMRGIVGFRMPVERLEGKFKLGQERSEQDRKNIVAALRRSPATAAAGDYTAKFYDRLSKR